MRARTLVLWTVAGAIIGIAASWGALVLFGPDTSIDRALETILISGVAGGAGAGAIATARRRPM